MDFAESDTITSLLAAVRAGDREAESLLVERIYPQLRRIAKYYMARERRDHTLGATALVHEAYVRLVGTDRDWKDRAHFFAASAQVMRQILVDYARQRRAAKRGGSDNRIDLDHVILASEPYSDKLLALDEALSRLSEWDLRQCRIVEMRFFTGLDEREIAEALGISERTVKREWALAKTWLYRQIGR